MPIDGAQIVNAILSGEAVLLTGAGFSRAMTDQFGDSLPIGSELSKSIWPIAFGVDEEFDPDTALSMVYDTSMAKSPKLLRDQLERHFRIDRDLLPERYKTWFSLPWHRIYTLNIDDGDEAVADLMPGSRLQIVSALDATPGLLRSDRLPVVHVNGRLQDFPKLTFGPWDFAARTAAADPWYLEFVADLAARPVVVIGSVLDEPPLWHYLTLRGQRGSAKELRPRSWLVAPRLDVGRKAMLDGLNFKHIGQTEEEFFDTTIAPAAPRLLSAAQIKERRPGDDSLQDVAESVRVAKPGSPDYLLGSAPRWGDITDGYSAMFEFDVELTDSIDQLSEGTVGVVGSAGSGKTTSLMKAAAILAARGNSVLWLGRETELPIAELRREVKDRAPDYLFVDDVDRFGGEAAGLLRGLQRDVDALVVVVGVRSARFYQLRYDERLPLDKLLKQARLSDNDAAALLAELDRGHRLGALVALSHAEQIRKITEHDDRQLLVTLIEATSGERFHSKIAAECRSLTGAQLTLYGVVCTSAWADNKPLSRQDLLYAAGRTYEPNDALQALQRLESSRLLHPTGHGYQARHRVVAESAVDYFRAEGLLEAWITDLIFLVAAHYQPLDARRTRYGRLLIRLINHQNLKRQVGETAEVQRIYGAAEAWLSRDPHFWLQRGSFETDYGDLSAADNFLRQARALASGDVLIDTAWAMLLLKRALTAATSSEAAIQVAEAFGLLVPIMQNPQNHSPHTYAVYLIYGLRWLKQGPLGVEEQRQLREHLRYYGNMGSRLFPDADDVQSSWTAVQKWFATNALVEQTD
ncbi:hypothetical protein C8K30_10544 [Promicromonospora sp. AC04]|uniref:ATP-binding protein n=1 Tax=Promicromonospora sp. AC04 TaxID=2135723 RepID=UPI000D3A6075|nr:ATP-binding protein [Promicromonospora sp. AC04]PUB26817.1 hypothetical protein C8K30_10544 [Promicromonospora sp. AC04]